MANRSATRKTPYLVLPPFGDHSLHASLPRLVSRQPSSCNGAGTECARRWTNRYRPLRGSRSRQRLSTRGTDSLVQCNEPRWRFNRQQGLGRRRQANRRCRHELPPRGAVGEDGREWVITVKNRSYNALTEGMSASSAIAVGIVAAWRRDDVKSDVALTGTIMPNGQIEVGGYNFHQNRSGSPCTV